MLEGLLTYAFYGVGMGGGFGNLMFNLEQMGFFSYALPFLMIFALVFAILTKIKFLGENRGINIILALATSLMALQFGFVSYFFAEIFPRMGVMLSIILVGIILLGLFFDFGDDDNKLPKQIFGGVVGIGFIVIIYQSFAGFLGFGGWGLGSGFGWNFWYVLENNIGWIIFLALFIGILVAMRKPADSSEEKKQQKVLKKMLKSN